jgi:hypothetical protein
MRQAFWKKYVFTAIISALSLGLTAGVAQAYVMRVISQNYSCQAEVTYTTYDNEWNTISNRIYDSGNYTASAVSPDYGCSANAYIDKIQSQADSPYTWLSFGCGGWALGPYYDAVYNSHSTAIGTVKFVISKQAGDLEDAVVIPFQFLLIDYSGHIALGEYYTLTLNDQDYKGILDYFNPEPVEISFQVGVPNTLSFSFDRFFDGFGSSHEASDYKLGFTVGFVGIQAVPLPGTLPLLLSGFSLVCLGWRLRGLKRLED